MLAGGRGLPEVYDAFISYSHEHDSSFAATLQTALERFAKPWYRMRALRVFRDDADLAANPGLWRSIEEALKSSRCFILLASTQSAKSVWVDREVSWWLDHRSPEQMLIAATTPGLTWDGSDWAVDAPAAWIGPPSSDCWTLQSIRLTGAAAQGPQMPEGLWRGLSGWNRATETAGCSGPHAAPSRPAGLTFSTNSRRLQRGLAWQNGRSPERSHRPDDRHNAKVIHPA